MAHEDVRKGHINIIISIQLFRFKMFIDEFDDVEDIFLNIEIGEWRLET